VVREDQEDTELICVVCNKLMECENYVEDFGQLCARCHYTQLFYRVKEQRGRG